MIIFENYRDKTNFPGKSIEIAKTFYDKKKYRDISNCYHDFFTLVPTNDIHDAYN